MAFDMQGYQRDYQAKNLRDIRVDFNKNNRQDMLILAWAKSRGRWATYVKQLILEDMARKLDESK